MSGEDRGNWFEENIAWKVGNENKINFWQGVWGWEVSLSQMYLRLCINSLNKFEKVGALGS